MVKKETNNIKKLTENAVIIQKTSLQLMESFDKLAKRIDKLVGLFEEASKHVGEVEVTDDRLKSLTGKIESLLEQNKDLAKGLLLLEEYVRGKGAVGIKPKTFSDYKSF